MKLSLGLHIRRRHKFFQEAFSTSITPPVHIYAKRYIKDDATCEDIVQEAFAQLWAKRKNSNHLFHP